MDTLAKTLHNTEEEIVKLSEHKERVEKALEAKTMPLEVAFSCLSLREGRVAIDLVRDEVEAQLNKVLYNATITRVMQILRWSCTCQKQTHSPATL